MPTSQLNTWRDLAALTLADLVPKIKGSSFTANDDLADDLLRSLAGQQPPPTRREPYTGLFGQQTIIILRQRAANGIKTYLERTTATNLLPADALADQLIRTLRGFATNLPPGVLPYEALFGYTNATLSQAQIFAWRRQAATRLQQVLAQITEPQPTDTDVIADALLRALGNQPGRPSDRRPFEGLILVPDSSSFMDLRQRGADALKLFVENIQDARLGSKDAVIDNVLRKISRSTPLPDRPIHRLPYEGLFRLSTSNITEAHLRQIATLKSDPTRQFNLIRRIVPYLNDAIDEYGISTPLRQAHFLAQLAHESDNFNTTEEYADGSAYEGRVNLGNTMPGDGPRYKGRGLIQVTGRSNYRDCSRGLGLGDKLINQPTLLNREDLASLSAGWYWQTRNLNTWADRDDVRQVTQIINGGQRGIDDRTAKLRKAKAALKV